jgi:hypothetical protein
MPESVISSVSTTVVQLYVPNHGHSRDRRRSLYYTYIRVSYM